MMATVGTAGRAGGFEIGLVMAGAVSAGAYTAGVVDFLIQALDQWHEGKRGDDPRCPRHDVSLKVMAGASAGGMSVAIAAAQLCEPHTPAADPRSPGPPNNKLLRSWVRRIDIARLLATSDLDSDPDGDVRSLLDSTALDEIAAAVFRREDGPPPPERSYLADPLHILLTVTNLQGIPYEVRFLGEGDRPPRMSMHGDHLHFALGGAPGLRPDIRPLPPGRYEDPQWRALSQSALATGAFPVGLAPRELSRRMAEYAGREWPIPGPVEEGGRVVRCGQFRSIPPDFPAAIRDDPDAELDFLSIDGGVDRQRTAQPRPPRPRRRQVFRPPDAGRPRRPRPDRHRALPRPADLHRPAAGDGPPVPAQRPGGGPRRRGQSGAIRPEIRDRGAGPGGLPSLHDRPEARRPPPEARTRSHLACGSVGGFGGFLSEDFRAHDFQLGRRNCQQFLRTTFALPDEEANRNPLFADGLDRGGAGSLPDRGGGRWSGTPPGDGARRGGQGLPADHPAVGDGGRRGPPDGLAALRAGAARNAPGSVHEAARCRDPSIYRPACAQPLSSPGPARGQAFPGEALAESLVRTMAEDLTARG